LSSESIISSKEGEISEWERLELAFLEAMVDECVVGTDTNNIILSCSINGQTIDGEATIIIESPYSAINLYSNGNNKYFIY